MSPSAAALMVIDARESFRHRPYRDEADLPACLERQQALIDGAAASGSRVTSPASAAAGGRRSA